jgi:uncharacterized protein YndB with AHSA1/START domain
MIKTTLIVALGLLAVLLIYAATRADSFRVERSTRVMAPPERVYALINDLRSFNRWNPYELKDPAIKGSYGGAAQGPGASYAWESAKVGTGRLEITHAEPASKVHMALQFVKPFEARNTAEFILTREAGATRVSWAMQGPMPFVSKLMSVFISMDRMVGPEFEAGLVNLKQLAEAS